MLYVFCLLYSDISGNKLAILVMLKVRTLIDSALWLACEFLHCYN